MPADPKTTKNSLLMSDQASGKILFEDPLISDEEARAARTFFEIPLPGGGVVFTDGKRINEADEPCRYACAAFPNCGCEVEALSPPPGICTCGKPVEPGFLLCLPCWREFHKDEQPAAPWEI